MNNQISNYDEDEIDLRDLLIIIIKEKKTVAITFLSIFIISLLAAIYIREKAKVATTILKVENSKEKRVDLLPNSILEKLYRENQIENKNKITLDEFKGKFKIEGIIPNSIKLKQEALEKKGETLKYIPENYKVELRVGTPEESKKVLEDYYKDLNEELKYRNSSNAKYKEIDKNILENYDYQESLNLISERKKLLKNIIEKKSKKNLEYLSYGLKYRDIQIKIKNLEDVNINQLQNYLDSTGIVKNSKVFKSLYLSKVDKLKNLLESKKRKKLDYEKLLDDFKVENKNKVVPKGIKIVAEDNEREKYYINLVNEYINIQDEIGELEKQISKLENINMNLKEANEKEREYIENNLNLIQKKYNEIVKEANELKIKENEITYGAMIKKLNPVVIVSNSKALLVLAVGTALGFVLGVMMAFVKNFFKDFKKYMGVILVFLFVGINSFSKEIVTISFTGKDMKKNENPDKTPFDLKNQILVFLQSKNIKIDSKEINVEPLVKSGLVKDNLNEVIEKIKKENNNPSFVPTEYIVEIPNKEILEEIRKNFSKYYINQFINEPNLNKVAEDENYRNQLKILKNNLDIISKDILIREKNITSKEKINEYKVVEVEIWKARNILYKNLEDFINTNKIVLNTELENILLKGERENILRDLSYLNEKASFYEKLLKKYNVTENEAVLLESGEISLSTGNKEREKQYLEISNEYAITLDKINELKVDLIENENISKGMREATKEEKEKIKNEVLVLEKEIETINEKLRNIELKNFRREYIGSVKVK